MNELAKVFNYQEKEVRTVVKDGEPWFVAKDVCEILELTDVSKSVSRLSNTMKGTNNIPTLGGNQEMLTVSEAGVYKLVFTSRKPEAERFTDWIASEVLPSIRNHGVYMTPETIEKVIMNPDFVIDLATRLKEEQNKRILAESKIEQDKSKVLFAEAVSVSNDCILIGNLAKLIKQNGYDIGEKRLFEWLREHEYLIKSGERKNTPTQKSMNLGLFEVREFVQNFPDGKSKLRFTTKVTGKGQMYFINKFLKQSNALQATV